MRRRPLSSGQLVARYLSAPFVTITELIEPVLRKGTLLRYGRQVALTAMNLGKLIPSIGGLVGASLDAYKDFSGLTAADLRILSQSYYVNEVVLTLIEKLSKKKTVVAFVDDAQWADSSS